MFPDSHPDEKPAVDDTEIRTSSSLPLLRFRVNDLALQLWSEEWEVTTLPTSSPPVTHNHFHTLSSELTMGGVELRNPTCETFRRPLRISTHPFTLPNHFHALPSELTLGGVKLWNPTYDTYQQHLRTSAHPFALHNHFHTLPSEPTLS